MRCRPHKFTDLVLALCLSWLPPEKVEEWWFQMEGPLPGETADETSQAQLEQEAANFMAELGALGG